MSLRGMTVYQVGPIDRCPTGGKEWREEITPFLENLGVNVLNPNNKKFHGVIQEDQNSRDNINEMKKTFEGRKNIRAKYGSIRGIDLRCVDKSDFLICRIDIGIHMCGSYEEITLANHQKKPVLIHSVGGYENCPSWLYLMLPYQFIFPSIEDLKDYVVRVDQGKEETLSRWLFQKD